MKRSVWLLVLAVLVGAIAGGVLRWYGKARPAPQASAVPAVASRASPASGPPPVVASAPAVEPEPLESHQIEMPAAAAPMTPADIAPALAELVGSKALATFFHTDDFPRRFVATVDNLGREHAPPMLWPVKPTPGRFTVDKVDGGSAIGADNSLRYTPFVLLVESVDAERAVDLYIRMYPLLQRAYEDLGYPKRYFNDRLIQVIDKLLGTPDAAYPVKVELTEVKGPIASDRPWVRYGFARPEFESLSPGQKMLLRVGPVNERRLKAKLIEIRRQLLKRTKVR